MYVVTLMAATETNFAAGAATFLFYGLLPCSVLMYLLGTKSRRLKRQAQEEAEQRLQFAQPEEIAPERVGEKTNVDQ